MSGFDLRTCTLQDLGQVLKIEKIAFPDDAYTKSIFLYFLAVARQDFIVATKHETVVGYVIATHRDGQGMIQSIAVAPESRRQGVGESLMRAGIDQLAESVERVYLFVDATHEGSIAFYRKLRFSETGRVFAGYYPNGDDALEMVRELKDGSQA